MRSSTQSAPALRGRGITSAATERLAGSVTERRPRAILSVRKSSVSYLRARRDRKTLMDTTHSAALLYVGIGMPMATVFKYAYVPKVMGGHRSTSWAASEITLFIRSLNTLLCFLDLSSPSIRLCEGFRSLQGVSISLQSYPMGMLGRLTGGLSPSLSGLVLSSAPSSRLDHCYLAVIICRHHLLHLRHCHWGLACRAVPRMV